MSDIRSGLFIRKSLDVLRAEAADDQHGLRRALGAVNLVLLGIGAIIGAGIFVLTGAGAAQFAGPAIVLSFVVAGVVAAFAGLCYAEFAALIPVAGSAYTYGYATLGEIFAWIIGWDLILEYAFGAAAVAVGWSGYVNSLLQDHGIVIAPALTASPGTELVLYHGRWEPLAAIKTLLGAQHLGEVDVAATLAALPHVTSSFNVIALVAILVITGVLIIGIKESANINGAIVLLKLGVLITFIGLAGAYLLRNPEVAAANWTPFIPPNTGAFGSFGLSGIARGAAFIFFAYVGFDAVSTAAQEARQPQRDVPIGILGSLAVCTVLYIVVSGLLTGLLPYASLNVSDPVARGIDATGVAWGRLLVKVGAVAGLTSTMLVMLLGQSRVFFSMSHDGLLPRWGSLIHPRFRTPYVATAVVGAVVAVFAALVPIGILGELVSIGTLLAFVIVCAGIIVLRRRSPELHRPFRTPWVPLVPALGILTSFAVMLSLPLDTWIRLAVWLVLGMALYFGYGRRHSVARQAKPTA